MKTKLFKHKKSGNVYTCLGILNHKDEVTREWVKHIWYTGDEIGVFYSRTPKDFNNNFEEIKA
jgi:hypothetical protein